MCSPASPSPTQQQTQITELPEWAKPYAKDVMAKGQALTDVNQNPYQTYNAPRVAGFTPMQEQAFQGAAGLGPAQAGLAGQNVALGASLGAMNTGRFGTRQAEQYMNPYIEASLAPQMELMRRQQGAQAQQMAGQATLAGAFGGSRYGLGQVQQNLANQLAQQNLVGQGYNTAYQNAMQQYNADQARRLQGLSTALQGAGQLGQLGAQQFGQQQAAIGLQGQMGAQQQAQQQRGLDVAYQDFLNQQNYPYKQLGFMSDLIRGLPLGQQSTRQLYDAGPTGLQTLGALGMGAYGLSKMAGGGSVTSEQNVKSIADMLPTEQLPVSYQNAQLRSDFNAQNALQAEMAERQAASQNASLQRGLGMAFDALPPEQQENVFQAAGGGIVAFARGGTNDDDETDRVDESQDDLLESLSSSAGNAGIYQQTTGMFPALFKSMASQSYTPMSEDAYNKAILSRRKALQEGAGPSPYADFRSKLDAMEADRAKDLEQNKGLAAFAAIPAILQGSNAIRGLGMGAGAFGQAYGQALAADKAEKRSLLNMNLHMADAERKENMGLTRDSLAAADQARKEHADAQMFKIRKNQALATMATGMARATKPTAPKAQKPSTQSEAFQTYLKYYNSIYPDNAAPVNERMAMDKALEMRSAGLPGVLAKIESNEEIKRQELLEKKLNASPAYNKAMRQGNKEEQARIKAEIEAELGIKPRAQKPDAEAPQAKPAAAPLSMPKTQNELKVGAVYKTARGLATWDGKQFIPVEGK